MLAYHDRSDGGLFVTLCEMAFAGRCGISIDDAAALAIGGLACRAWTRISWPALFAEELGAVVQVREADAPPRHRRF